MKKQDFIDVINDYLYINNNEMVSKEIKLDKYTIYIDLKLNILCIRVLNNKTDKNVALSTKKYKNYIDPIIKMVLCQYLGYKKSNFFRLHF